MITGPHVSWVSNVTVLKTGRSAREYGVRQSCYGPIYGKESLDYM